MEKRIEARKEHFGYTLFDTKLLRHKFVSHIPSGLGVKMISDSLYGIPNEGIIRSPVRIYYELTNACNLKCLHCLNDSGKKGSDELSLENVLKMIQGFADQSVFDVRISGGEPTIHPNWLEIFQYIKSQGMHSSVNTNGCYGAWHDEIMQKYAQSGITQVTVSLEGRKEHHDRIRGKGSYDQALRTLKDLKHVPGMSLRTNTVLMKGNIDDFLHVIETASKSCDEIAFFYMRPVGRGVNLMDESMTPDDLKFVDDTISEAMKQYPDVRILHSEVVMHRNSIPENKFNLLPGLPDGFTRLSVLANGDVLPNCYMRHQGMIFGNLKEYDFNLFELWHNNARFNEFRRLSSESLLRCAACIEKETKQCPGESMELTLYRMEHGNNPYCKISETVPVTAK